MTKYIFHGETILDDTEKHPAARSIGNMLCLVGVYGLMACMVIGIVVALLAVLFPKLIPALIFFWGLSVLIFAALGLIGAFLNAVLESQELDTFW